MTTPKPGYKTLTKAQLLRTIRIRDQELAEAYKLMRLMKKQQENRQQIHVIACEVP